MKKVSLSIFGVLLLVATATAQHRQEVSVNVGGGFSTLNYRLSSGLKTDGYGGQAGLGYAWFFNQHVGLYSGLNVALFNAKANLGGISTETSNLFREGEDFTLRSTMNVYTEKQQLVLLQVPLMLQLQTGGKHQFSANVGVKVGLPLSASYNSHTIIPHQVRFYGYDYWLDPKTSTLDVDKKLKFGLATTLSLETGVKWALTSSLSLYTGVYFDYGLNDVRTVSQGEFFKQGSHEEEYIPSSVLMSVATPQQSFADKVVPAAFGINLRFSFGSGSAKSKSRREELEELLPLFKSVRDTTITIRIDTVIYKPSAPAVAYATGPARQQPAAAAQQPVVQQSAAAPKDMLTINFPIGQVEFSQELQSKVDSLLPVLLQSKAINIVGHTCNLGQPEVNRYIGQERADVVKRYLLSKGVDVKCITTSSAGSDQPLVANISKKNRDINRRVEITYDK
jgi:outer membrane protein OmpA-like peptidoglycan-associated protein